MSKMYSFDNKLLCGSPEIRIGDKVYPIDARTSTVKKVLKIFSNKENDNLDSADEALKLAFGKNYAEIAAMDMPFSAYQKLIEIVVSAMTGEEPKKTEQSFLDKSA
ncbi:MAG: hypothetical protein K2H29_02230 [Oscillospiraceae bacterium]|nr:hypothetical protein [Oscillospiraceae bacterium]